MALARAFFRHGSNALLLACLGALAIAYVCHAIAFVPWTLAVGALLFFLNEYGTHRFLLHARPAANATICGLQRRLHYDHHLEPERLDLLFLPPWFLFPALALFALIYAIIARDAAIVAGLACGNMIGLLYYEWVHYVAHVPLRPVTPYGRYIKKYHLWHHFKNERLWFGVTNPSLDVLSRTYVRVADAERSTRTRTLFR